MRLQAPIFLDQKARIAKGQTYSAVAARGKTKAIKALGTIATVRVAAKNT